MERPGYADRKKLADWADSIAAPSDLPRLIRRLILETTPGVVQLGMPAAEGVSAGSWDGAVRSTEASAFVPQGLSLWELSVAKKEKAKADKDYGKRISTPDESSTTECTYVAGILRGWTNRAAWAQGRTGEGRWKEVRAYGLDEIEAWLETAPVTWAWISERLGLNPHGLRSAETWWDAWSAQTSPSLPTALLLAGRSKQVESLRQRLTAPQITTVAGPSLDEVRAFLAAMAISADAAGDGQLLARMVFVDDPAAWRSLMETATPLYLVPTTSALAGEVLTGSIHHVIVPVSHRDVADLVLEPVDASEARAALADLGMEEKRADEAGRLARRSMVALRRNLATKPALHVPAWSGPPASRAARAALLAGSWSDKGDADREILASLGGKPYESLREMLASLGGGEDPLVIRVDDAWHLVSPYDAWSVLRAQVSEDDLKRLEEAVRLVLGEVDPALDLPQDQRWMASVHGKQRAFSGDLRHGLARTLALLGVHGGAISSSNGGNGVGWAGYLVRSLLEAANKDESGQRWASLSHVLPLLAEAAPDRFLDAVRAGVAGATPVLGSIFMDQDSGGLFSGSSAHTGVLWALEGLAWSDDHFSAAVDLLARLDALDPGGRLSNRPFESIAAIFCPWHPENSVTPERRLAVIDGLRKRHADCAWRLEMSMLPDFTGVHMPTHEPAYRDWKPPQEPVTNLEYYGCVAEVVSRAIEDANGDPGRWRQLLDRISHLIPDDRRRVVDALDATVASGSVVQGASDDLWKAIRDLVGKHREFADAKWALPPDEVDRLDAIADRITPASSQTSLSWLFIDHMPHLGDVHWGDDHERYERLLATRRQEAVGFIDGEGGLDAIRSLAAESKVSGSVGVALADAVYGKYDTSLLGDLVSQEHPALDLAHSYFARRFMQDGWPWLDALLAGAVSLSPNQKARLLLATRDHPTSWERADELGKDVADEFWRRFLPYGLGGDFKAVELVATRMMGIHRNAAALDFVGMYMLRDDGLAGVDAAALIASGLQGLLRAEVADPEIQALSEWDYHRLFGVLEQHRDAVGVDVVAGLEWAFLPALGFEPPVPSLHERMATEPAFFVEVLSTMYRGRSEEPEELDAEQQAAREARANNGYRLLSSWSVPPGMVGGSLSLSGFKLWFEEAVAILRETDREDIGLNYIGQVLVSAPADEDGAWPPAAVRDILEEVQSDSLEDGFRVEILNRRGVVSRGLEDGGVQEQDLVKKYRADADQFVDRWPRTATILRDIASSYEAEARRNEESAERFRKGLRG